MSELKLVIIIESKDIPRFCSISNASIVCSGNTDRVIIFHSFFTICYEAIFTDNKIVRKISSRSTQWYVLLCVHVDAGQQMMTFHEMVNGLYTSTPFGTAKVNWT